MSRFAFAVLLFVFPVVSCKPQGEHKPDTKPAVTEKPEPGLPELALFLSGKTPAGQGTKFEKIAGSAGYKQYADQLGKIWATYSKDFTAPVSTWRDKNVGNVKSDVVFYPFAGPDFPNADTMYPDQSTCIMVGLEPAGEKTKFEEMSEKKIQADLKRIVASVDYVSRRTYFITSYMNSGYISAEGVGPILLLYLGLMDYIPYSFKAVDLDEHGKIIYLKEAGSEEPEIPGPKDKDKPTDKKNEKPVEKKPKRAHSIEIRYQVKAGEPLRTIYYFKQDVEDQALERDGRFLTFMDSFQGFASVFKAASYLPHYETFGKVTGLVLKKSELIIMDDTGPMLKKLNEGFDVTVFGKYGRPIHPFQRSYQPDMAKLFKAKDVPPINFRYGYGAADGSRGIIIARKNPDKQDKKEPEKER